MNGLSALAKGLWTGATALALAALGAGAVSAQLPANATWRTIDSPHFRVTYEPELESLARHAAASAERAHGALGALVAHAPHGIIDIVLADNLDQSNGYATPFPSNRIVLYAKPPVDVLELQHTRDWIELVVTHELAHIFHLDVSSGAGRLVRTIFGRVPAPWPVFPAVGVPGWSVEGLAVGVESAVTGLGRVHGSFNEMVVRSAALAGRLDEYDRLGSGSVRWPGAARIYIYGSLFMDYLARRHGAGAAAAVVRSTADAVIPPPLWFNRVGTSALGVSFRDAYADWLVEVGARADSLADVIRAQGMTTGLVLTDHRATALHPRFSPDGSRIAYAAHDWRTPPHVRVIDAATGAEQWSEPLNRPAAAAWISDDRLITSENEFTDRFHVLGDLRIVGDAGRRITRGERLQDPDASRDGRIVAVQNESGTNRLVLVTHDQAGTDVRPITAYDPHTHWSMPRFSPGGNRIAAGRWQTGGAYDIVVLDTLGSELAVVSGFGINAAPAWSPDGRWILFSSDRTGIQNIYAADAAQLLRNAAGTRARPFLRQVTNVLTGAFHPDVSADGRWIAYAAYTHDGFRIERLPFDTTAWRQPAPTAFARRTAPRVQYAPPDTIMESAAVAAATADTLAGESHTYSALRSLRPYFWLPVIETGVVEDATFIGIWSYGQDLVGRHTWDASVAVEPDGGRTQGWLGYTYRGLPTIAFDVHPALSLSVERDWDTVSPRAAPDEPYINEREDIARLTLDLNRTRWRSALGLSIAGERIRRSHYLHDAPPGASLADPRDDMWGVRVNAGAAAFVAPPLSISRENGYTAQVTARQRWEPRTGTRETENGIVTVDAAYRELTTWNTAYVALPIGGFARHVIAARFSGLLRDGPGAGLSRVGGAAGGGFALPGAGRDIGGSSTLLPVRGFARGARAGSNAWTASLEYRAPLALIDASLRPFFFDRISAAVFADAGHAWCSSDVAERFTGCASVTGRSLSLASVGAEIAISLDVLGLRLPLRTGGGIPIRGAHDSTPRFYLLTGPSF